VTSRKPGNQQQFNQSVKVLEKFEVTFDALDVGWVEVMLDALDVGRVEKAKEALN